MRFDDESVDVSGVEDRRGMGGLVVGGGGLGIVGVLAYVVMNLFGGGDGGTGTVGAAPGTQAGAPGSTALPGGPAGASSADLARTCSAPGALDRETECRIVKVYNVADRVWREEFQRRGRSYAKPGLVFFEDRTRTGCGAASAAAGPFYCPGDRKIYFDLGFLQQLQTRFGARGQFAQAYIVAHEYGHHIQTLTGTERKVRAAQQRNPRLENDLSVAMELQADCYAGVWSQRADRLPDKGIVLTRQEVAEAINAAAAVGDDRIQSRTSGRVNPESWTHGAAEQRQRWFLRGLESGDPASCDTFDVLTRNGGDATGL